MVKLKPSVFVLDKKLDFEENTGQKSGRNIFKVIKALFPEQFEVSSFQ